MAGYTKQIRQMRVFSFDVLNQAGKALPIIGIDRQDGLKDRLTSAFGFEPTSECRPRNIGLMLQDTEAELIVTNADNAGYSSTELMRILNQTGFQGELLFLTNGNTYPLHLLRRLNNLALDFDLGTISMATLRSRVNAAAPMIAKDPTQPSVKLRTAAVG